MKKRYDHKPYEQVMAECRAYKGPCPWDDEPKPNRFKEDRRAGQGFIILGAKPFVAESFSDADMQQFERLSDEED